MVYVRLLLSAVFIFIISGCSQPDPPEIKTVKKDRRTLSKETELKASSEETIKIKLPTVVCNTCKKNIEYALSKHNGIVSVEINIKNKFGDISYDPAITTPDMIRQVISEAGYDADDTKRNLNAYQNLDECCKIELNIHS